MSIEELLELSIQKSKGTLPLRIFVKDEAELEKAQKFLKGKRNTKALILEIGKPVPSHKFPDDDQYIRTEIKKIETPEPPTKPKRKKKEPKE